LQLHPNCVLILDEAAAGKLKEPEYHHWAFENQPEWEPFRTAALSSSSVGRPFQAEPAEKKTIETVSDPVK
jgi:hypothetical protein